MKYILKTHEKKKKFTFISKVWNSFTKKQRIGVTLFFICLVITPVIAQTNDYFNEKPKDQTQETLIDIVQENVTDAAQVHMLVNAVNSDYFIAGLMRNVIKYITDSQIDSIKTVAELPLETDGIFDHVFFGITIFACIGCVYKLIIAFLRTESFDNLRSIFSFFSYIPILVLFIFSQPIVDHLVSLNEPINGNSLREIGVKIDNEVVRVVKQDLIAMQTKLNSLDKEYYDLSSLSTGSIIGNRFDYLSTKTGAAFNATIKFTYFSVFAVILISVLAIPAFLMTFLVKVLLTLMVAGTKIVFLLAFIPGFDDLWKTFLKNILSILLWIPIFNVIMSFITSIVTATIVDGSMMTGQIVWLTIVAVVCAYQAIGLTTSTANAIINGSGASMAGALGAMGGMNATSFISQSVLSTGKSLISLKTGGKK